MGSKASRDGGLTIRCSQGVKHTDVKKRLLMVKPPKPLSPHIKMSTTVSIGGVMEKAFIYNWLKSWFSSHIRANFRHQLARNIPNLVVVEGWITTMRTTKSMLNSKCEVSKTHKLNCCIKLISYIPLL